MSDDARHHLRDLLAQPEGAWSLADGALAIARLERPGLDPAATLAVLDELGGIARQATGSARHPRFVAAGIARVLHTEQGFRLATDEASTPDSCFLDQVVETGVGNATLLSVVFIEVARRCGARFEAIAMPGHFLLRFGPPEQPFLFDPTREARPVSLEEARKLVRDASGGRVEFRDGYLRALTRPQILARILGNLKAIYWRVADYERALATVRLLLIIRPDDPREIRDQGRVLFLLGRYQEAIGAFESYLAHNPRGEDADVVRMLLLEAKAGLKA